MKGSPDYWAGEFVREMFSTKTSLGLQKSRMSCDIVDFNVCILWSEIVVHCPGYDDKKSNSNSSLQYQAA